jgi:hypothetical protein
MMGGDMGQIMAMMRRMMAAQGMMGGAMGGPGAMQHFERIDAHLAYVRTALRVTDAHPRVRALHWLLLFESFNGGATGLNRRLGEKPMLSTVAAACRKMMPARLLRRPDAVVTHLVGRSVPCRNTAELSNRLGRSSPGCRSAAPCWISADPG